MITVPSTDDMNDDTFLKHLDKRHRADTGVSGYLAKHPAKAEVWISAYRAFHKRLHAITMDGTFDHEHIGNMEV